MADAVGLRRGSIYNMATRYQVTLPKGPGGSKSHITRDDLIACRDRGMTRAEAARALGVSKSGISRALRRLGVDEWPRGRCGRRKAPQPAPAITTPHRQARDMDTTPKAPPPRPAPPPPPPTDPAEAQSPVERMRAMAARENAALRRRSEVG